jgi:hypothetical protein
MNPAQSLQWLAQNRWTMPQIAGVARVTTSAVRAWLSWRTAIPVTPGLRLMIAAYLHQHLLASFESPPALDGERADGAASPLRRASGAPGIRNFADLVARHCRA